MKKNHKLPFTHKAALFLGGCVLFFSLSMPLTANVTIEPNGVLPPGTTLTVRIELEGGSDTVEMEMVADENRNGKADKGEYRHIEWVSLTDGQDKGDLRDYSPQKGLVEVHLHLSINLKVGHYIVRARPGAGRLAKGAALTVDDQSDGYLDAMKAFFVNLPAMIKDPPPTMYLVRSDMPPKGSDTSAANLWLMDGATHKMIAPLTRGGNCTHPAWSPDGKKIVYARGPRGKRRLWITTVAKKPNKIKTGPLTADFKADMAHPAWSPGGDKIAFISNRQLWVCKPTGAGLEQIAVAPMFDNILCWSRDGRSLVCSAHTAQGALLLTDAGAHPLGDQTAIPDEDRAIGDLFQVTVATGKTVRLPYHHTWHWLPYLSPDGRKAVFDIPAETGKYRLWLREGKGFTKAQKLGDHRFTAREPRFSPDGRWLVLVSDRQVKGN